MSSVTVPSSEDRVAVWVARSLGVLAVVLAGTAVALPLVTGLGYLDDPRSGPAAARAHAGLGLLLASLIVVATARDALVFLKENA